MSVWIVAPTYNEADNVIPFIESLQTETSGLDVNILIVDDNSPDGTSSKVNEIQKKYSNVFLLSRPQKDGLGRAYLAGFRYALAHSPDFVVQMDADFSHRPEDVRALITACEHADVVIGSRYVPGGSVGDWSKLRYRQSLLGSSAARFALGVPVKDLTGGFKCWRAEKLSRLLDRIISRGFVFQAETTYLACKENFTVVEAPITFAKRRAGKSKMHAGITFEGLVRLIQLRWRHRKDHQLIR